MMQPDNWPKIGWQQGLVVPGQKYSDYMTGNENVLHVAITEVLNSATSMSGTPWNDFNPGDWKANVENYIQEFAAGITSVDEFLQKLDSAVPQ